MEHKELSVEGATEVTTTAAVILGAKGRAHPAARRALDVISKTTGVQLTAVLVAPDAQPVPLIMRIETALTSKTPHDAVQTIPPDLVPRGAINGLEATAAAAAIEAAKTADLVIDLASDTGDSAHKLGFNPSEIWFFAGAGPRATLALHSRGASTGLVQLLCREAEETKPAKVLAEGEYTLKPLATRSNRLHMENAIGLLKSALGTREMKVEATSDARPLGNSKSLSRPRTLPYLWRTAETAVGRLHTKFRTRLGQRPGLFHLRLGSGGPLDFDAHQMQALIPPKGHFWADPFLIKHNGTLYCFYEDMDLQTGLGTIDVGVISDTGMSPLGTVLKSNHHLSYPFVFEAQGALWMMPETHQNGRLEIWRAVDFPLKWELANVALEGTAPADSVLFQDAATWWLFTNLCGNSLGDYSADLHLYRTEGPMLQQLEAHPLNPVIRNSETGRGGGRVFRHDGRLFRTSQDNSRPPYGYGLNIMEVTQLSAMSYRERRVRHLTPDNVPGVIGCHHIDAADGKVIIDARLP